MKLKKKAAFILLDHVYSLRGFDGAAIHHVLEDGWVNTFFPLILPALFGTPYYIFLARQFNMSIPIVLDDAAKIDGCNKFTIPRNHNQNRQYLIQEREVLFSF